MLAHRGSVDGSVSLGKPGLGDAAFVLEEAYETKENNKNISTLRKWMNFVFFLPVRSKVTDIPRRIIHPQSYFYVAWSLLMAAFLIYIAITVPFRIAFDDGGSCDTDISSVSDSDLLIDTFFLCDVALNFLVCRVIDGYLSDDRKKVMAFYFKNGFLFDLLKSLPVSYIQVPIQASGSCNANIMVLQLLKILKGLRVLRLVRLVNLRKFLQHLLLHQRFLRNPNVRNLLKMLILLLFSIHCLACLWWFVKKQDENLVQWEVEQGMRDNAYDETPSTYSRYLICFYFSVTTLTTVGYGDIKGDNDQERLVASISMLIGGLLFATVISIVSTLSMSLVASDNYNEARKEEVINFMQSRKIPTALQRRVTAYYDFISHSSVSAGLEMLEELPASLRYALLERMAVDTLTNVHFFRNLDVQVLVAVYIRLAPLRCGPGEIIVREGDTCSELYFIIQGQCVVLNGRAFVEDLNEGDFFGASSVFQDVKRSTTIASKDFSELYVLSKAALEQVFHLFPDMEKTLKRRADILRKCRNRLDERRREGKFYAAIKRVLKRAKNAVAPEQTGASPVNLPSGGGDVQMATFGTSRSNSNSHVGTPSAAAGGGGSSNVLQISPSLPGVGHSVSLSRTPSPSPHPAASNEHALFSRMNNTRSEGNNSARSTTSASGGIGGGGLEIPSMSDHVEIGNPPTMIGSNNHESVSNSNSNSNIRNTSSDAETVFRSFSVLEHSRAMASLSSPNGLLSPSFSQFNLMQDSLFPLHSRRRRALQSFQVSPGTPQGDLHRRAGEEAVKVLSSTNALMLGTQFGFPPSFHDRIIEELSQSVNNLSAYVTRISSMRHEHSFVNLTASSTPQPPSESISKTAENLTVNIPEGVSVAITSNSTRFGNGEGNMSNRSNPSSSPSHKVIGSSNNSIDLISSSANANSLFSQRYISPAEIQQQQQQQQTGNDAFVQGFRAIRKGASDSSVDSKTSGSMSNLRGAGGGGGGRLVMDDIEEEDPLSSSLNTNLNVNSGNSSSSSSGHGNNKNNNNNIGFANIGGKTKDAEEV